MKFKKIMIIIIMIIMQACNEKEKVDLGGGYRFDYNPVISSDYAIFGPYENTYAINGQILNFNFDSNFIIAEQKPRALIMKDININSDMTFKAQERLFEKSLIRRYWIIDKRNDSIYGPYKMEEYVAKRLQLMVPKNLELKNK